MKTNLAQFIKDTPEGREANSILRACVHCGFCTATCPTYQLLGDELDGPRGRIYLMKEVLEGREVTAKTQLHLDRCLTCRSCETTCPSGVKYGRLVDIGRNIVEQRVGRSAIDAVKRKALRTVLPHPMLFKPLLELGQLTRPLLPAKIRRKVPPRVRAGTWPAPRHPRRMLVLEGCVQPAIAPSINPALARVLDRIGVSVLHRAPGGLLRCRVLSPECAGGRAGLHAPEYRRLVAASRGRRRSYRDDCQWLWGDGKGVRPLAGR